MTGAETPTYLLTHRTITIALAVAALAALLGAVFYWYTWRPAEIRRSCVEQNNAVAGSPYRDVLERNGEGAASIFAQETLGHLYERCVHQHGLQD